MAFDEVLATRIREALTERADFTEIAMFGGLAFMVNTHMACGALGQDMIVRVGKTNYESALSRGVREMDFTGRPMRGIVVVPGDMIRDQMSLGDWVDEAVEFAKSDPPKISKTRRVKPIRRPH